jgi:3-hydroxyisobutyrate dehydrogenase
MHAGFIGLGHLGRAMAQRLLDQRHTLTVWNRTPDKARGLKAETADSPRDTARTADIVCLCLFDSDAVHSVLAGKHGLLSGDASGRVIVDFSTNHFKRVTAFHELCRQAGARYLECPVLGSVVPASQGTLTVLVGGDTQAFAGAEPLLQDLGQNIFYLKEPGLPTKMKLINNLTLGSFMAAIAEALALAEAAGIKRKDVLDILAAGGGDSLVLRAKRQKLEDEDFSTHFSSALIYKDLHCLQDLAYELKMPLFTGAVAKELYARTFGHGLAQEDFSAVFKLFKAKYEK